MKLQKMEIFKYSTSKLYFVYLNSRGGRVFYSCFLWANLDFFSKTTECLFKNSTCILHLELRLANNYELISNYRYSP